MGTPTTPAYTTMGPSSALQVSDRSSSGEGRVWGHWFQASPLNSPFLAAATCSHLGQELLVAGGNVVDAGVGAALCLAVVHPHATGLGQ